jgi:cysteine desulfurase/selenocysteine lyase
MAKHITSTPISSARTMRKSVLYYRRRYFMRFSLRPRATATPISQGAFSYLEGTAHYFDTACQSLRPESVIAAEAEYYHSFNSCGHRVKYAWGIETDKRVEHTRALILSQLGKSHASHVVAFCLNTTAGINAVLQQLSPEKTGHYGPFARVVTSDIEHNSVFLSTLMYSQRHHLPRLVLERAADGTLQWKTGELDRAIVVVNTMSNIDGRQLGNLAELAKAVHENGGILLLDACQSFGHDLLLLQQIDFDACFGSGHKMYGPSVGFIVAKRTLVESLEYFLIGGSTVLDVERDSFTLTEGDELYARLEPGLQNYAGILGLGTAIQWKKTYRNADGKPAEVAEKELTHRLAAVLHHFPQLKQVSPAVSSIVSLYHPKIDGHVLGKYLAQNGVMCRTGYHCCHYFLQKKLQLPPLLRISLGLHNDEEDFVVLENSLHKALKALE